MQRKTIIDTRIELCRFIPTILEVGDYTFAFNYKIPDTLQNPWPASYHLKRNMSLGFVNLHTKYKLNARLE